MVRSMKCGRMNMARHTQLLQFENICTCCFQRRHSRCTGNYIKDHHKYKCQCTLCYSGINPKKRKDEL